MRSIPAAQRKPMLPVTEAEIEDLIKRLTDNARTILKPYQVPAGASEAERTRLISERNAKIWEWVGNSMHFAFVSRGFVSDRELQDYFAALNDETKKTLAPLSPDEWKREVRRRYLYEQGGYGGSWGGGRPPWPREGGPPRDGGGPRDDGQRPPPPLAHEGQPMNPPRGEGGIKNGKSGPENGGPGNGGSGGGRPGGKDRDRNGKGAKGQPGNNPPPPPMPEGVRPTPPGPMPNDLKAAGKEKPSETGASTPDQPAPAPSGDPSGKG